MGIAAGFVALRHDGFLEPRNGVVPLFLLDQIGPDIVVRVSEIGIYLYGLQTLGDGAIVIAEERISPAAESVGLGRGESIDGMGVEIDCLAVLAGHLLLVAFLKVLSGGLARISIRHKQVKCACL